MNEEMIAAFLASKKQLKVNKHPYKPKTYTEAREEKSKKLLKKEESKESNGRED